MKDQATEASVNALNVNGLRGPSAPLNQPTNIRPCPVEQGKGVVEGEGCRGVLLQRMNGQNQHKTSVGMRYGPSALQRRFKQRVRF